MKNKQSGFVQFLLPLLIILILIVVFGFMTLSTVSFDLNIDSNKNIKEIDQETYENLTRDLVSVVNGNFSYYGVAEGMESKRRDLLPGEIIQSSETDIHSMGSNIHASSYKYAEPNNEFKTLNKTYYFEAAEGRGEMTSRECMYEIKGPEKILLPIPKNKPCDSHGHMPISYTASNKQTAFLVTVNYEEKYIVKEDGEIYHLNKDLKK